MQKLGLDLGSSSIGWAIREDNQIENWGVITFQSGMVKGQGGYSSPTKDRRESRSKRRLIQARKYRKWELLKILLNEFTPLDKTELETWSKYKKGQVQKFPEGDKFLKWLACDFTYEGGRKFNNPYELRVMALDNRLSKHEFGRALYHLVQRRGYKDVGEADKETEKQIVRRGESGFNNALKNNRTIAEALTKDFLDKGERARNQYPYRDEYENELLEILKAQGYDTSKNDKNEYNDEFIQKVRTAIIWQRPLRIQKGNIGRCTLEPDKPRCPVSHPIFEIFRAWSFINTIKYYDDSGKKTDVGQKEREVLFEFFLKKEKNFKFEEIRSFLDKHFKSKKKYNYPTNKDGKYDMTVSGMPVCKGLINVLGDIATNALVDIHLYNIGSAPKIINRYSIYDLWHILFAFDEKSAKDNKFLEKFAIEKLNIQKEKTKKGEEYNPYAKLRGTITTGYGELSLKAMCKIIPFLKEGYLYNEAVVLAKIPELLGEKWEQQKDSVLNTAKSANKNYNQYKTIVAITNSLINQYKGLEPPVFAFREFKYNLAKSDLNDIQKSCIGFFGEKTWNEKVESDRKQILDGVRMEYQAFFHEEKRTYRKVPLLTDIFKTKLKEKNIEIDGKLYHHSNIENRYLKKSTDPKTGKVKLPIHLDKDTGVVTEILPLPNIDSIKNPMFNKSMSILRRLINEHIKSGNIDEDTEVVIEVARELNDNNKRVAIERYQREREAKRKKHREFLNEFNEKEKKGINVEENIPTFELWTEQIFELTTDERGNRITNVKNSDILREKEAIKRYELWTEQKGQCMYTGMMISISKLFSTDIDVMHTIPRWLLPDNTMENQTVGFKTYNKDLQKEKLPTQCANYDKDVEGWGTSIASRLNGWMEIRDNWKKLYEDRLKPKGNEDESAKNKRVQEKHYFKMHYDYWKDKVARFTAEEIKDSWARRQLVDTQMVSKYAREFLKTYFKKVAVQKGSVTADFRKIYGFQEEAEIKSRNKHTHHAIDAAVLTLIPVNSSHRERVLREYYEAIENFQPIPNRVPFAGFNSQTLIQSIENNALIVNYKSDKILNQTYKNVRKRGNLQYLKDKQGKFRLDENGNKILLKAKGDTVRSELYAQTFLGKIKDVERDVNGQSKREENDWKYKTGKDEFIFVKREPIDKVKGSDKLIEAIIDPVIKKLVKDQKNNSMVKFSYIDRKTQEKKENIIRHVRIKTSAGKKVKDRVNYLSKHEYKNQFYSEAGALPYAILLQSSNQGKVERAMIPVASFELAKSYKKYGRFVIDAYLKKYDEENETKYAKYPDKKLLKVGQKVLVLKDVLEYEKRKDINFQTKRLYVITQFSEGSIWLKYHLEAQSKDEIKNNVSILKDSLLCKYEKKEGINKVVEDLTIQDNKKRREDYENRRYRFDTISNSFRLKVLSEKIGLEKTKRVKNELDKFKAISGSIEIEGKTSLLKMASRNWNFIYEGEDFEVSLLGGIKWIEQFDDIHNNSNILNEPLSNYSDKSIHIHKSFNETEDEQLQYFASLKPKELLHYLKTLVLSGFGYKKEPGFVTLPKTIHFKIEKE